MTAHIPLAVALGLVLAGPARSLAGQSLADIARQEAERRKATKDTGKVITNKDLPRVPPSTGAGTSPAPAAASAPAEKGAEVKDPKEPADAEKAPEPVKDQAYWAGRLKSLQEQLDRDQTYADALQSRINALSADFVNRDDPAQRAVLATNRQKAVAELERLKLTLAADKQALADFQEEARRAGVPPGWLR